MITPAKTSTIQLFSSNIVLVKSGDNFWVKVVTAEKWGSCPQVTNLISETKLWPFSSTLDVGNNIGKCFNIRESSNISQLCFAWKVTTRILPSILFQRERSEHKIYIGTSSATNRHFCHQGQVFHILLLSLLIYPFIITLYCMLVAVLLCNDTFVLYEGERGGSWSHPRAFAWLWICQVKSIISVANSGDLPKNLWNTVMLLDTSDTLVPQHVMMHSLMHFYDAFATCVIFGAVCIFDVLLKYWCTYYPNYNMCDITEKPDIGQIWPKNYAVQLICPKLEGNSGGRFDQLMLSTVGYLFPNPISTGLNLNFNERHLIFRFRMSGDLVGFVSSSLSLLTN